ncbi:MAG: HNH endonuclease [Dehalococcoidia bacterium]
MARPSKPCREVTCWRTRPCPVHPEPKPFAGAERSSDLYRTARWRREQAAHLEAEPACRTCGAPASVVDHIEPHRGNEALFWSPANRQSLCKRCSNSKTAREVSARRVGRGGQDSGPSPPRASAVLPGFSTVRIWTKS